MEGRLADAAWEMDQERERRGLPRPGYEEKKRIAQLERQLKETKALLTAAVLHAGGTMRLNTHEVAKLLADGVTTEITTQADPARITLVVRL